jgi:hypothetical protein
MTKVVPCTDLELLATTVKGYVDRNTYLIGGNVNVTEGTGEDEGRLVISTECCEKETSDPSTTDPAEVIEVMTIPDAIEMLEDLGWLNTDTSETPVVPSEPWNPSQPGTPPEPPSLDDISLMLNATYIGNGTARLSWIPSSTAQGYNVYWLVGNAWVVLTTTTSRYYDVPGLAIGVEYMFAVSANFGDSVSAKSVASLRVPLNGEPAPGTVPNPEDLPAGELGSISVGCSYLYNKECCQNIMWVFLHISPVQRATRYCVYAYYWGEIDGEYIAPSMSYPSMMLGELSKPADSNPDLLIPAKLVGTGTWVGVGQQWDQLRESYLRSKEQYALMCSDGGCSGLLSEERKSQMEDAIKCSAIYEDTRYDKFVGTKTADGKREFVNSGGFNIPIQHTSIAVPTAGDKETLELNEFPVTYLVTADIGGVVIAQGITTFSQANISDPSFDSYVEECLGLTRGSDPIGDPPTTPDDPPNPPPPTMYAVGGTIYYNLQLGGFSTWIAAGSGGATVFESVVGKSFSVPINEDNLEGPWPMYSGDVYAGQCSASGAIEGYDIPPITPGEYGFAIGGGLTTITVGGQSVQVYPLSGGGPIGSEGGLMISASVATLNETGGGGIAIIPAAAPGVTAGTLGNLVIISDIYVGSGTNYVDRIRIYTADRANGKWANTSYTRQASNTVGSGTRTLTSIPLTFANSGNEITATISKLTLNSSYSSFEIGELTMVYPASDGSYWTAAQHEPHKVWIAAYGEENNDPMQLACLAAFGTPAATEGQYEWDGTSIRLFDLVECGVANT